MAFIKDITVHLPEKIVTNEDLQKEFPDADMSGFEDTVGVVSRHIAAPDETALDLGEAAARKLLEQNENPDIDFILFCTQTPDYHAPGNAGILQHRLGISKQCGALDFNLGCSGYVYGLSLAKSLIETGMAKNVLFVASDAFSGNIHPRDRVNRALFGDGATATLIGPGADGIGEFVFGTDGSGYEHLIIQNGCARNPYDPDAEEFEYGTGNITDNNHFYMNGLEIFSFTARIVPGLVRNTLEKNGLTHDDIDHYVFHQANEYMLKFLRKKLKVDEDRFYINLKNVGNTSASTIPIGLDELLNNGTLKKGQKVMIAGYGIGLSWAGTIITI
jgi:3-oxoacyl-[acyl-carrier-protein] synthase-3